MKFQRRSLSQDILQGQNLEKQFEKFLQKQMQKKAENVAKKQENIFEKEKNRRGNKTIKKEQKFEKKMNPFNQLTTFVDIKKFLQRLNAPENQKITAIAEKDDDEQKQKDEEISKLLEQSRKQTTKLPKISLSAQFNLDEEQCKTTFYRQIDELIRNKEDDSKMVRSVELHRHSMEGQTVQVEKQKKVQKKHFLEKSNKILKLLNQATRRIYRMKSKDLKQLPLLKVQAPKQATPRKMESCRSMKSMSIDNQKIQYIVDEVKETERNFKQELPIYRQELKQCRVYLNKFERLKTPELEIFKALSNRSRK